MSWTPDCLVCVVEAKTAGTAPPNCYLRPAITFAATNLGPVTPICWEHLEIKQQSSLIVPAPPGAVQMG